MYNNYLLLIAVKLLVMKKNVFLLDLNIADLLI